METLSAPLNRLECKVCLFSFSDRNIRTTAALTINANRPHTPTSTLRNKLCAAFTTQPCRTITRLTQPLITTHTITHVSVFDIYLIKGELRCSLYRDLPSNLTNFTAPTERFIYYKFIKQHIEDINSHYTF
jgi:hypothetical protein